MFCLMAGAASAQYNETNNLFYHSFRSPNSNDLNPAFFPLNNTFYLRLPGFESAFGSPLAIKDVVHVDAATKQTVVDINNMLNTLSNDNDFRFQFNLEVLGFGFKIHNTFVDFNIQERTNFSFGVPVSMVDALRYGNVDENGNAKEEVLLMDGDLMNMTSYAELSVGAGHYFAPINLTVGFHAKLLYGAFNFQTENTRVSLKTDPNFDRVVAYVYYQIQEAGFAQYDTAGKKLDINTSEMTKMSQSNTGFAFDIGAKYNLGPLAISVAINDLTSGIRWKNNINTIRPKGGMDSIVFDGLEASTLLDGGKINTDSLSNYIKEKIGDMKPEFVQDGEPYWYSIPTKINVGLSYSFATVFRAGLLFHGQFDRGLLSKKNNYEIDLSDNVVNTFRWNTTASLGINLFNWAELMVGSSLVYDGTKLNWFNPGIGFSFSLATIFQMYIMTDYMSSIYVTEAKAFNFKFGLNLLIGKGGRSQIIEG